MVICPSCASENEDGAALCQQCGASLNPGANIEDNQYAPPPPPVSPVSPVPPVPAAQPAYTPPPPYVIAPAKPPKDKSIAMILEILLGLFGIYGIGRIYSGQTTAGIIWLIAMLVWGAISAVLAVVTVSISLLCTLPINIIVLAIDLFTFNDYTKQHPEIFGK